MATTTNSGQGHLADNLEKQLNEIMVQMGRIFQAPSQNPERADQIVVNAKKKMTEATDSFHSTLDEMEMEIIRAKAVFLRDLHKIQEKQKAAAPAPAPAPIPTPVPVHAPVRAQPPAPMVIDLDPPKAGQASAPVAPMMALASPSMQNRPNPKASENKPVAPFPDMGIGTGNPTPPATVPFHPVKAAEGKRASPKQTTKSGPPSGRLAHKTSPLVNRQPPKTPASVPPAAPAVAPVPQAPPPATNVPPSNVPTPQNPFTSATFTLDPTNSDLQMQPGSQDVPMDLTGFDESAGLDGLGLEGAAPAANAEAPSSSNNNNNNNNNSSNSNAGNDSSVDDLDHFFDLGGSSNANFDENFNISEFMNNDFAFDTFE
ncbi:hypothetical protein VP1G_07723 [Cytospora mali]|uniref:Uncharacterized protein n=1 Tax=Cytospora mali TaxID=578113 RepID=A0A194V9K8_CYTMA|nr:hypothetical protein VP1G_07723 [Valsa mali var. pyri (nom. inval.)]